jgi:hypothetical protein
LSLTGMGIKEENAGSAGPESNSRMAILEFRPRSRSFPDPEIDCNWRNISLTFFLQQP